MAERGGEPIRGRVFNIQRFSVDDGPGIRTTVFLKGCPLRCRWCHNPEGLIGGPELGGHPERCVHCFACVEACPTGALSQNRFEPDMDLCDHCGRCAAVCPSGAREMVGDLLDVRAVVEAVLQDRPFFDESGGGATLSGGEPVAQPEFAGACLDALRRKAVHTALDTSGHAPTETFLDVARRADLVLFDVKQIDGARHRADTGVGNRLILHNLGQLSRSGHPIWVRVPLIPGVNDSSADLDALAGLMDTLPRRHPVWILPYHRMGEDKLRRLTRSVEAAAIPDLPIESVRNAVRRLERAGHEVHCKVLIP